MAAEPATNRAERVWLAAYLAFFVALSFVKAPAVLLDPRFWAEDGSFYFTNFRALDAWWEPLVYVAHGSYQLLTNFLVYLATKVPLEQAPAVTTYGAYLVEALVVVLIHAVVGSYGISRFVGLLLVAAWVLMPASYETWASATNVQWICSVSMLLVLMLPNELIERHFVKMLVWTAVCGFTGVPSCMLAPGYLARAYTDRSKHFAAFGAVLALCTLVQLAVAIRYGVGNRSFASDPRMLTLPMLLQTLFVPLFGIDWVGKLSVPLRQDARALSAFTVLAGLSLMLFVVAIAWRARRTAIVLVVAGLWILVSLVNTFGTLGSPLDLISGKGGERYFLFGAMCFCLLLAIGTTARSRFASAVAGALLLLIVGASAAQLGSPWLAEHTEGPSWKRELTKCVPSAPCVVAIWPNGWNVKLRDQSAR